MKKKILIVSNNDYVFVKRDVLLLQSNYKVTLMIFNYKSPYHHLKLINNIIKNNIIICWLAHNYSLFVTIYAKILNRKVITIPGGDEVVNMPEYKYGALSNKIRYYSVKETFEKSDCIIPVNNDIKNKIKIYYGYYKNINVIHTAPDPDSWTFKVEKKPYIITVGNINSEKRFFIKGIDRFIKLANEMPQLKFILVGMSYDLGIKYPSNMDVYNNVDTEQLAELYKYSKVYCQLSRSEGTPNSVCEAMLSGCIPVCNNVGGMGHLCKEVGFLINNYNLYDAKKMILKALKDNRGQYARKFILENYSLEYRKKVFKNIIDNLFN